MAPTASSRRISACVRVSRRTVETLRVGTTGGGGTEGQVMTGGAVVEVVGGLVVVVGWVVVGEEEVVATVVSEVEGTERKIWVNVGMESV